MFNNHFTFFSIHVCCSLNEFQSFIDCFFNPLLFPLQYLFGTIDKFQSLTDSAIGTFSRKGYEDWKEDLAHLS